MNRRILLNTLILLLPTLGAIMVVLLGLFLRFPIFGLLVIGLSVLYLPPLLLFRKEPRIRVHPKTIKISYHPGMDAAALWRGLGSLLAFTIALGFLLLALT